jgi:hypothetical protein
LADNKEVRTFVGSNALIPSQAVLGTYEASQDRLRLLDESIKRVNPEHRALHVNAQWEDPTDREERKGEIVIDLARISEPAKLLGKMAKAPSHATSKLGPTTAVLGQRGQVKDLSLSAEEDKTAITRFLRSQNAASRRNEVVTDIGHDISGWRIFI